MPDNKKIDSSALAQISTEARTHNTYIDRPVPDALPRDAVEIAKIGPTCVNHTPLRIVFLRSTEAKERLRPAVILFPRRPRFSFEQIAKII